jgi:surface protein
VNSYTNRTHLYSPGSEFQMRTITVNGLVEGFDAGLSGDFSRFFEVIQWGSLRGESNSNEDMFKNCHNLTLTGVTGTPNWVGITSFKNMFVGASSIETINGITSWDLSTITDMSGMFYGTISFNQDISSWNTSNVTNMDDMFNSAESFNQNLSSWCVTSIPTLPTGFYDYTTSWVGLPATGPQWGTCPP